jgi:hypothetical protein
LAWGISAVGRPDANIRRSVVNIGDTTAPYWADLTEEGSEPFVLGDRHRIHIPHQQIILAIRSLNNIKKEIWDVTYSPK